MFLTPTATFTSPSKHYRILVKEKLFANRISSFENRSKMAQKNRRFLSTIEDSPSQNSRQIWIKPPGGISQVKAKKIKGKSREVWSWWGSLWGGPGRSADRICLGGWIPKKQPKPTILSKKRPNQFWRRRGLTPLIGASWRLVTSNPSSTVSENDYSTQMPTTATPPLEFRRTPDSIYQLWRKLWCSRRSFWRVFTRKMCSFRWTKQTKIYREKRRQILSRGTSISIW